MDDLLSPDRFAIFVSRPGTGLPMARLPIYAEVVWTEPLPAISPDGRFREALFRALSLVDDACSNSTACRARIGDLVALAIARALEEGARDALLEEFEAAVDLLANVIARAVEALDSGSLNVVAAPAAEAALEAALSEEAERRGLALRQPPAERLAAAYPLGLLASDHVGYLSWDLTRLPEAARVAIGERMQALTDGDSDSPLLPGAALWVYPLGLAHFREDALVQRRFAEDAIVFRLEIDLPPLPAEIANLGLLALQNPGLPDWRLSPGSFASHPAALLGDDGCETILPANLALHERSLYQVVGLPEDAVDLGLGEDRAGVVRPGFVNEYRVSLVPLGHSLGQILYSFPLAPGESVNFAVIDWTRRDNALRTEATTLDESLVHELRRDRTISETVDAAIREVQRGSSFMAGLATAAGAAFGRAGMGLAAGLTGALGGTSATTRGSRDIAVDTVQRLSDTVSQAASATRELNSTVVVQTAQAEHEAVETRTVVNYNHSHALTILYYEVLRHYRLVIEFTGRRPVVLARPGGVIAFPVQAGATLVWQPHWPAIRANREVIEAVLLDPAQRENLEAMERGHRRQLAEEARKALTPAAAPAAAPTYRYFMIEMRTGGLPADADNNEDVQVQIKIKTIDDAKPLIELKVNGQPRISTAGAFFMANSTYWFAAEVEGKPPEWDRIGAFDVHVWLKNGSKGGTDISFSFIKITGIDQYGGELIFFERAFDAGHIIIGNTWNLLLPSRRPPAPLPPPGPAPEIVDDDARVRALSEHLIERRVHYQRAVRLGTPPAQRADELAAITLGGGATLLDKVENRPLDAVGDWVAYPVTDETWADAILAAYDELELPDIHASERLVTLPTRGVFAEAKLGHCNASEPIDNTRFWDWQSSPIPHMAPEIAPVQTVVPQFQAPEGTGATAFPASLLNIVNPPAAPDPHGMTAALSALATANIFRDMSGQAQLANMLKTLSDNAVAIAAVAEKAAAPTAGTRRPDGAASGGARSDAGRNSVVGGQRAQPNQPSAAARDLQDFDNVLKRAVGDGVITPDERRQAFGHALGDATGALDLQNVDDRFARGAYTPRELAGLMGEQIAENALRAEGHLIFADWRKHVSAAGFDLVTLDKDGVLWIVDNKAQFRGIGQANALTGPQRDAYLASLDDFLAKMHPGKAEADLARAALAAKKVRFVVSNGFAGETTRFTKALFERGLDAYDIRFGKLFSDFATWETQYKAIVPALKKGVRLTGRRGVGLLGVNVLAIAAVAELGHYMLSSGADVGELATAAATQVALETVLSRLPGGFFAGFVLNLRSDQGPAFDREQEVQNAVEVFMARLPGMKDLSKEDYEMTRSAVETMIRMPIELPPPPPERQPEHREFIVPFLKNPMYYPVEA